MAVKDKNRKVVATPAIRRYFSDIRAAREHKKEWEVYEEKKKALLVDDELGGERDITCTTERGAEVGSVTEYIMPGAIDWAAYAAAHPELAAEFETFRKPATTQVRITTKWVEPDPVTPPVD